MNMNVPSLLGVILAVVLAPLPLLKARELGRGPAATAGVVLLKIVSGYLTGMVIGTVVMRARRGMKQAPELPTE